MGRSELVIVMALILFMAFLLGWTGHWLFRRFNRVDTTNISDLDDMANALHEAEETRDEAVSYMQDREADLVGKLSQIEAERDAAMEGLGVARREAEELRTYIEENSQS